MRLRCVAKTSLRTAIDTSDCRLRLISIKYCKIGSPEIESVPLTGDSESSLPATSNGPGHISMRRLALADAAPTEHELTCWPLAPTRT
jgi:hypothetical protein